MAFLLIEASTNHRSYSETLIICFSKSTIEKPKFFSQHSTFVLGLRFVRTKNYLAIAIKPCTIKIACMACKKDKHILIYLEEQDR